MITSVGVAKPSRMQPMKSNNQRAHEAMGLCWHEIVDRGEDIKHGGAKRQPKCSCGMNPLDMTHPTNPDYENSISDAWKLVESLERTYGWVTISVGKSGNWSCHIRRYAPLGTEIVSEFITHSGTAPKAIVAAFLAAQGER